MLADLGQGYCDRGRMDQAEQLISETSADVVLLDVNLYGEQRYALASALALRGIPFIFSTGYGSAGLKAEWRATPVLEKPFQARDLERAIRLALSNAA